MLHGIGKIVEVADIVISKGFSEIDFGHAGFHQPGDVAVGDSACPVQNQGHLQSISQFIKKPEIDFRLLF